MKVTVLGAGAYAIALALMLNENNCDITMWTKFEDEANMLSETREHKKNMPGVILPVDIQISTDLSESLLSTDLIVIAVPAHAIDDLVNLLKPVYKNQHLCIATKGIENDTCLFPMDILLNNIKTKKLAVISGPSFAVDIAQKVPVGLTLATRHKETELIVKKALQNNYLKLRTTSDLIGTSICGSIKNVIAVASGMIAGMKLPESTQAMFITESLHDIKELIHAAGGDKKTILSFAGFGDLLLTCTSVKSRNFRYGFMIGAGEDKTKINDFVNNTTIEGLYTLKSIYQLVQNKKVNIPIIDLIYDIVFNNENPSALKTFLIEKQ